MYLRDILLRHKEMIYYYIIKALLTIFFVALIYIPIRVYKLKKYQIKAKYLYEITRGIFVIYITVLISLLLVPNFSAFIDSNGNFNFSLGMMPYRTFNIVPFVTVFNQIKDLFYGNHEHYPLVNIIINIVLFMPFPVLLKLNNKKISYSKCYILSTISCIIIEILQYPLGRSFDIDDIILNNIGILMGILFCKLLIKIRFDKTNQL